MKDFQDVLRRIIEGEMPEPPQMYSGSIEDATTPTEAMRAYEKMQQDLLATAKQQIATQVKPMIDKLRDQMTTFQQSMSSRTKPDDLFKPGPVPTFDKNKADAMRDIWNKRKGGAV